MNSLELAKALIACPSVTPKDAGCQTIIRALLTKAGFSCETLQFGDVTNLWATYGDGAPVFVFAGHTDVVPPGNLDDWETPPFEPTIRNGNLYGRGATDMKGALAAMVVASQSYLKKRPSFSGTLAFLVTSDEEGPGVDGTKRVMEILSSRGIQIDYGIVGEASSQRRLGDQIRIGRRGSLHGKLRVNGKQGHVAHPHLAQNPIQQSLQALHSFVTEVWDEGNQDFPATSLQITNVHAGTGALNVIPASLDVYFNFRYSTAVTQNDLKKRTQALLDRMGLNYHIEWNCGAEPFLSKEGKLRDVVTAVLKEETQQTVLASTGGGTSDARFIAPTGAEVIELGVIHESAHQVNEHVAIDDLESLTRIYERILTAIFNPATK